MAFPEQANPDHELDRMKVAFSVFVAKLIVDADGIVDFGELKLLSQVFPDASLQRMGFMDAEGGLTDQYRKAYTQAMKDLPNALELEEKLELVTLFHRTCMADGELMQAELLVLREAAEVLGIPLQVLSHHLDGLKSIAVRRG